MLELYDMRKNCKLRIEKCKLRIGAGQQFEVLNSQFKIPMIAFETSVIEGQLGFVTEPLLMSNNSMIEKVQIEN